MIYLLQLKYFILAKNKYLKERVEIRFTCIPDENSVGSINGLWANSFGKGGIIPIEIR